MTKSRWAAIVCGLMLLPAWSQAQLAMKGKPAVMFTAIGPAGLTIEGKTSELSIREDDSAVLIVVPLSKLDTGISLRNTHMREKYLETPKYPNAELRIEKTALKRPAANETLKTQVKGLLTIHGKTQPVTVKYTARLEGKTFAIDGTTHVKLADYAITVPSYLGVTVKQDIDIEAHFSASEP